MATYRPAAARIAAAPMVRTYVCEGDAVRRELLAAGRLVPVKPGDGDAFIRAQLLAAGVLRPKR